MKVPYSRPDTNLTMMIWNVGLIFLLGCGLAAAGVASEREWRVFILDEKLTAIEAGLDSHALPLPRGNDSSLPARAALSAAMIQASAANAESDIRIRGARLEAARMLLEQAERGRPGWSLVAVAESFVATVNNGPASREALRAYQSSFVHGAFLHDAAPWRIWYGLDQWRSLNSTTRHHVVAEAAWYSTLPEGYVGTMTALVGHPAETMVMRVRADLVRTGPNVAMSNLAPSGAIFRNSSSDGE